MPLIKVLLVDDDEDDFILTKELINDSCARNRYELTWSSDYKSSLQAMLKEQHDIYLVDYKLGKYSGINLLDEAVKSGCGQPIIILTGEGHQSVDEEAMRLGAADYLIKNEISSQTLERSLRYAHEHHKTLQKLQQSENKFRIIFERSKDPMLISDYHGRIYDANAAAMSFFELTREELLRKNAADFYKDKAFRKLFTNSIEKTGSVTNLELETITARGKIKHCRISSFMQISNKREEAIYYTTLHDITNGKLLEQENVSEEKFSAIERVARNIANEIYNPLSNINLALDELRNSVNKQDDLILLDIVKNNCETINRLTTELIKSTQAGALDLRKIRLNELLHPAIQDTISKYHINVEVMNLPQNLSLYGDEIKLSGAIQNILENAAEALNGNNGLVTVDTDIKSGEIVIKIADTGQGIAKENLNKIFEPFYSTKPRSSGLGLTQAQRIIRAHDGKLKVKSVPGKGTTMAIHLPQIKNQ